jgi:hypothetical protein
MNLAVLLGDLCGKCLLVGHFFLLYMCIFVLFTYKVGKQLLDDILFFYIMFVL